MKESSHYPDRRKFLAAGLTGALASTALPTLAGTSQADVASFELDELSVADLQDGMQSGNYTCRSLAAKYLARIEAIDRHGPVLRSVIEGNPDAMGLAEALDKRRKEKGSCGPLHGIPILIKDNVDTADRMSTTAGSLALIGSKPSHDAFLVN